MFIDVTKLNMPQNHDDTARFKHGDTLPSVKIDIADTPSLCTLSTILNPYLDHQVNGKA